MIKNLVNVFIILPDKCKACNKSLICLRNNNSPINPLLGKCNWYKCNKEIYLRKNTIFQNHNKTPAYVIYTILDLWLNSEFNLAKISKNLAEIYNQQTINKAFILKFLHECRIYIAHYIRDNYCLQLLAPKNELFHIAVDESLFTHLNGGQIWVISRFKNETNELRLDIAEQRD